MTWFKVDDNLAFHRKTVAAGNAAMGLWVRAGSWSAQHLTDGFVPEHMIALLGTPSQAKRLVKAGLWAEVDGGCQFHQWNEKGRQPTSAEVLEERAKNAARQAAHRERGKKQQNLASTTALQDGRTADEISAEPEDASPATSQVTDVSNGATSTLVTPLVTGVVTGAPTRPDPYTPSNEGVAPQKRRRATRIPEDFTVTADMVEWARDNVPDVDGRRETDKFIDFWRAKPGSAGVKADWVSTWRNWMRKAAEDLEQRRPTRLRAVSGEGRPAWLPAHYDDDGVIRDKKTGRAIER